MSLKVTKSNPFADAEIVTSLLGRQDEIIAELDSLDAQVINVIEEVIAQRESSKPDTETLSPEEAGESKEIKIADDSLNDGDSQFQKAA